jgi:hypothetical protein
VNSDVSSMNMPQVQLGHVQYESVYRVEESEVSIACVGTLRRLFVGRRVMTQNEFLQLPVCEHGYLEELVGFVKQVWGPRKYHGTQHEVFLKAGRLYRCPLGLNWHGRAIELHEPERQLFIAGR